jgi:hypothetical protein
MEFDAPKHEVDSFPDNLAMVVTVINTKTDLITDHVFCNCVWTDPSTFTSSEKVWEGGIFTIVNFCHGDEAKSLWELFEHYDGKILTCTHEEWAKIPRDEVEWDKVLGKVYMVTYYSEKNEE